MPRQQRPPGQTRTRKTEVEKLGKEVPAPSGEGLSVCVTAHTLWGRAHILPHVVCLCLEFATFGEDIYGCPSIRGWGE